MEEKINKKERTQSLGSKVGEKTTWSTDVASKGLDFPIYNIPPEIENYVHRIGRTEDSPVLAELNDPTMEEDAATIAGAKGYCGGLVHRIRDCPELEHHKSEEIPNSRKDYFGSGGG
ncbi:hypothetical protein Bca101_019469 [Brassica carinata]